MHPVRVGILLARSKPIPASYPGNGVGRCSKHSRLILSDLTMTSGQPEIRLARLIGMRVVWFGGR